MSSVLVTTEPWHNRHGKYTQVLQAAGLEVAFPPQAPLMTEEEVIRAMQGQVASIAGSEPYTARVLEALPDLRVIARHGVGYDRIDIPAATRLGIPVTITPDGNYGAVAEHVFALMLAVARKIVTTAVDCRAGKWVRHGAYIPLRGRALGVVGLGRIGRSVAQRAHAFGMQVLATELYPDAEFVRTYNVQVVDLPTLLEQSDFVTLHTPMLPETTGLINAQTLATMKRGSVLINTARGGLVNEQDLVEALRSGHLAGAGLDVLSVEPPPPDHPLLELAVVSPHVAAMDAQALEDMSVAAAESIVELTAGRFLCDASLVNPVVETAWKIRAR